jgi:hypothetical protein
MLKGFCSSKYFVSRLACKLLANNYNACLAGIESKPYELLLGSQRDDVVSMPCLQGSLKHHRDVHLEHIGVRSYLLFYF